MAKHDENPFLSLDKSNFPKSRKKQRDKRVAKPQPKDSARSGTKNSPRPSAAGTNPTHNPEVPTEESENLFIQAMHGVAPLNGDKGRHVAPPPPAQNNTGANSQPASEEAEVAGHLADLVSGKVEFALEHTEEYIHGHVLGLDSKLSVRLKAGFYSPEAHLDLHGMNAEQAFVSLVQFIKENYMQGRRCVLLIPGRGKNSPEGYGVLRQAVQAWLTRDPLKRVVLAFCTALPKHGGAGALYVLLRKHKGKGKINWERLAMEDFHLP